GGPLGGQLPQVDLRGLVGAMLGPHHGVHRKLVGVGIAAEGRADRPQLVVGEPELPVERLGGAHAAETRASEDNSNEANIGWPPVAPTSGSTACSGCGIRPTAVPASFRHPAVSVE